MLLMLLLGIEIGTDMLYQKANKTGVAIKHLESNTGKVEIVFGQFKKEIVCTK